MKKKFNGWIVTCNGQMVMVIGNEKSAYKYFWGKRSLYNREAWDIRPCVITALVSKETTDWPQLIEEGKPLPIHPWHKELLKDGKS